MRPLWTTLLLLTLAGQVEAATYYVSTTGNDASATPTNRNTPWRTCQKAANTMNAGDTALFLAGTYTVANTATGLCNISRSGTASAYITFKSEVPLGATLSPANVNGAHSAFYVAAGTTFGRFVRVEGFVITGFLRGGVFLNNTSATGWQIVGNYFHTIGRWCDTSDFGNTGVFAGGASTLTVDRNRFRNIGRFFEGENGCTGFANANVPYNHDHGIYMGNISTVTIQNNLFEAHEHGWAIQCGSSTLCSNVNIRHNTFVGKNPGLPGQIICVQQGCSNWDIANNISYQPSGVGTRPQTSGAVVRGLMVFANANTNISMTIRNNMVYQGVIVAQSYQLPVETIPPTAPAGVTQTGNITGDTSASNPLFVNAASDWRLQAGSPAINAGVTLTAVTNDFAGNARPAGGGYDLGAYEFGGVSDTTPPAAPTGVFVSKLHPDGGDHGAR